MSNKAASLQELLDIGRKTLSEIAVFESSRFKNPRVCFHFFCADDEKHDRWGKDAECVRLSKPLFEAMPFGLSVDDVGGCVGIEAWEKVCPTEEWLKDRIPRMLEVARLSRMNFIGWSFEPEEGPLLSAGVNVMNANTPEGAATMDGFIESLKATKH